MFPVSCMVLHLRALLAGFVCNFQQEGVLHTSFINEVQCKLVYHLITDFVDYLLLESYL